MTMEEAKAQPATGGARYMRKRRTTLGDGRYLIYYTFDDEDEGVEGAASGRPEPAAEAEAAEERNV
jgi:hypothetical protein